WLLLKIGFGESFTAVGIHEVNAHGHAQIFGWVGLFVMGFAYQAFPRFKHTTLAYPALAFTTLWLMLIGITGRVVLEPLGERFPAVWPVAMLFPVLEVVAIGLFVWIILTTLCRSGKPLEFYDAYILCALAWFFIQGIYAGLLFAATAFAATEEALLSVIATWQAPLREIQIHGFAMLMILGVSQRMFPNFYGFKKPNPTFSLIVLAILNLSLLGIVAGFYLMRTASPAWAGLWYTSILALTGSVAALVWGWRLDQRPEDWDRSLKFLRMAYVWLHISLAMLVLLPLYQFVFLPWLAPQSAAVATGFSHAYYGAIRHAITVGFVSMMIVGVAAKVVPTLNGVDLRQLTLLWAPFWLLNIGCAFRVVGQTLTDIYPSIFPFIGISGLLEFTALLLWGIHLVAIMRGRVRLKQVAPEARVILRPGEPIALGHVVGDVLHLYPHLLDDFVAFGFLPLKNSLLRHTLARTVTIASACRKVSVDVEALLRCLNQKRTGAPAHSVEPVSPVEESH
ncbi:MAG: NnrS family protein, partial [bacterium]|nr:NnrS family protein [bacterium]